MVIKEIKTKMKKHFINVLLILSLSVTATVSAGPFKKAGAAFAVAAAAKHMAKKKKLKALAKQKKRMGLVQRLKLFKNQQRAKKTKQRKKQSNANLSKFLSRFKSSRFYINGVNIIIDKKGMKHILERHHLKFWKGKITKRQSFLPKNMTTSEIKSLMFQVLNQNKTRVAQIGSNGIGNIFGIVNGVKYQLGLNKGRIGQFFNL